MEYILPIALVIMGLAFIYYMDVGLHKRPSEPSKQKRKPITLEKGIKLKTEESGPELVVDGSGKVRIQNDGLNVYEKGLYQSAVFYCPEVDRIIEVALGNNNLIQFRDEDGVGFLTNSPVCKGMMEDWTYSNFGDNCVFLEIGEGDIFESEELNG